ncbi:MAG: hypothetical protein GXY32_09120 [Ruminococcaceae bacterium]|nr:hypothetical protein [Oscillospiraceae bacterium]
MATEKGATTVNYSMRINAQLLKKFRFVAENNMRTANKEIELLMRQHVQQYEQAHGEISADQLVDK